MDVDLQDKAIKSCIDWENAPGSERTCTDEDPCQYHDDRPQFFSVGIYLGSLAYGGPEEGGWWYDQGEPSRDAEHAIWTRVFKTREECYEYAGEHLNTIIADLNQNRRPKSSVLSSGVYEWHVVRGYPRDFPEKRPHYE